MKSSDWSSIRVHTPFHLDGEPRRPVGAAFGGSGDRRRQEHSPDALLRRFTGLRLTGEPLAYRDNLELRGLKSLPVAYAHCSA
jgi:hypothetical protein